MKKLSIEEKSLLLKDLCSRLPYNVLVCIYDIDVCTYDNYLCEDYLAKFRINSIQIRPYLRPISSMTKKEREEFNYIRDIVAAKFINAISKDGFTLAYYDLIDWLNAHHFDYRGLIGAGLALEAPEGMYNVNEK